MTRILEFRGEIWPSNTTLDIPGQFQTQFDGPHSGKARGEVNDSDLVVYYKPSSSPDSIHALRGFLQRFVDGVIDSVAYLTGRRLQAEIGSVVMPSGDEYIFPSKVPEATHIGEDRNLSKEIDRIARLFDGESGTYLRLALKDYKSALLHPHDTGFYCYRAIESIRQSFKKEDESDSDSWKTMREELGIERRNLDYVKGFSDERRHGDLVKIDNRQRSRVLIFTWGFIWDFVDYLDED